MPDVNLKSISWRLDIGAGHWLPADDLSAVTAWMSDNRLDRATAAHPVIVENGGIRYGQDRSPSHIRHPHRDIVTTTVPLRTPPPAVWQPTCGPDALARLADTFGEHEWTSAFDGACVDCSSPQVDSRGRLWCHRNDAVLWPCPPVQAALEAAGMPISKRWTPRLLGDCLSAADNAAVFGSAS